MTKKLKVILPILMIVLTIVGVGSLLAYLTSKDHKSNIFTLGRVKIELNEANWDQSLATNLKPNDSIEKDPTIKNIGRNQAYVYLKVITPIVELMDKSEGPLFNYTTNQGWTELSSINDCNYQIKTYYYNTALSPNDSTTSLFDSNFGPNVETIQDMIIYGYAIQTNYLQNGTTIPTIFTSHFSNNLSDTTVVCPGMVRDYNGEGCATITNDSSGGGGNENMSGLTLMMKNASLGTDEDIDFTMPAANWIDNFSETQLSYSVDNMSDSFYNYSDSYTFDTKTKRYTLTNSSVGKYSDVYSSLVGKYVKDYAGSNSMTQATFSSNLKTIYKITYTTDGYVDRLFEQSSFQTRTMSTSYQEYYYTYADNYTFNNATGKFSLVNPNVGKYSDIYSSLIGKFIVSTSGSTSSTGEASTNIWKIYKVGNASTLTSLQYKASSVSRTLNYVSSNPTQVEGDNGQGVYTREGTENDKYPIYYYRGTPSLLNNLVFGGFCWKIVRTTATGGIRMIYNGVVNSDNSCGMSFDHTKERTSTQSSIKMTRGSLDGDNYTYTTGTDTSSFPFNVQYQENKYVGYMYETDEENDTDSNLKRVLDAWYSANLTSYDNKIEDSIYCNDRTYTTTGSTQYYCPRTRGENGTPTTLCTRTTDAFGVKNGNKKSTHKVGFLTLDELNLAGRGKNYGMIDYLYDNGNYWTGSPYLFYTNRARVFYITQEDELYMWVDKVNSVGYNNSVRPVITLKANTNYTGTGTLTDPFIVN